MRHLDLYLHMTQHRTHHITHQSCCPVEWLKVKCWLHIHCISPTSVHPRWYFSFGSRPNTRKLLDDVLTRSVGFWDSGRPIFTSGVVDLKTKLPSHHVVVYRSEPGHLWIVSLGVPSPSMSSEMKTSMWQIRIMNDRAQSGPATL